MKKLLLTGFEPFLDYPINPTMDIVNELSRSTIHSYEIVSEILPVHYKKSGKKLIETIKQIEPDAVISLGLGGQRHHINPERIAINCNDGPEDNHGYKPNGEKIIPGGKDGIFTTLPIQKMVKTLREAHLPASISNSAGTYLCNNVMYHALYYFEQHQKDVPSGFIHIPASHALAAKNPNMSSWSHEDLLKAIKLCIQCL